MVPHSHEAYAHLGGAAGDEDDLVSARLVESALDEEDGATPIIRRLTATDAVLTSPYLASVPPPGNPNTTTAPLLSSGGWMLTQPYPPQLPRHPGSISKAPEVWVVPDHDSDFDTPIRQG